MKRPNILLDNEAEPFNAFALLLDVDWTEPWLIGLVGFHTVITLTTLLTRHNGNIQGVLFFILLILVYSSEALNELAAKNWRFFSRQQYFDSNGMFISIVFSAPLLLNCIIMVGQWMWSSGILMIKLKQKQLKIQLQQQQQQSSHSASVSGISSPTTRRSSKHSKNE